MLNYCKVLAIFVSILKSLQTHQRVAFCPIAWFVSYHRRMERHTV